MQKTLPDILVKRLDVIFVGINPGLTAAVAGHHFVSGTNRFWRAIHGAGFTPHQIPPQNDHTILQYGCGLTTLVSRPTARADQISSQEFLDAVTGFETKMSIYAPRFIGFLGKPAYGALSGQQRIAWGPQTLRFGGGQSWVLPNPSGLNRSFTLAQLIESYRHFYLATD